MLCQKAIDINFAVHQQEIATRLKSVFRLREKIFRVYNPSHDHVALKMELVFDTIFITKYL